MNDPVDLGSLSFLPLLRLLAELSQIDDFAHLGLLESVGETNALTAQTAHLTQSPSPQPQR